MKDTRDYEDATVVEQLDFDVPCVSGEDHAAVVLIACRFCDKNAAFACLFHYARWRLQWMLTAHIEGGVRCGVCRHAESDLDALFKVVPIGGRK